MKRRPLFSKRMRLVMSNDRSHRTALTIFAVVLAVAIITVFIMPFHGAKLASNETQPGTIGLARPHPPLDRAPGEAVRN